VLTTEHSYYTLREMKKGEAVGVFSFFTGQREGVCIRSLDFSKMLSIRRSEFLALLKHFPEDYEVFCYIADQLRFQHNFSVLGVSCEACHKSTHDLAHCPLVHFEPDTLKVVRRYTWQQVHHVRDDQYRTGSKEFKRTLEHYYTNVEAAIRYL
jgi:hypothetical protein